MNQRPRAMDLQSMCDVITAIGIAFPVQEATYRVEDGTPAKEAIKGTVLESLSDYFDRTKGDKRRSLERLGHRSFQSPIPRPPEERKKPPESR